MEHVRLEAKVAPPFFLVRPDHEIDRWLLQTCLTTVPEILKVRVFKGTHDATCQTMHCRPYLVLERCPESITKPFLRSSPRRLRTPWGLAAGPVALEVLLELLV